MGPGFRQDDPVIWTAERDRQRSDRPECGRACPGTPSFARMSAATSGFLFCVDPAYRYADAGYLLKRRIGLGSPLGGVLVKRVER